MISGHLEFSHPFETALRMMEETHLSIFITGRAGTGKSTLLSHFCENTQKNPVILAPTGVAALHVKGQTIHKFFNFYVDVTPEKIQTKKIKPRNPKLYKKLRTLIIDEISMVRADLLDCIDIFLRLYGQDPSQPFGGVQMIFVGDLYQLPPVVTSSEQEIFQNHYKSPYFFSAHVFEKLDLHMIELEKIYRQKDQKFQSLLNAIRNSTLTQADMSLINARVMSLEKIDTKEDYIYLTPTNHRADEINETRLKALKGKTHHTRAVMTGDFTKEYFPTSQDLIYKIGSQIMLIHNDPEGRWVNGSLGTIQDIGKDEEKKPYLAIELREGDRKIVNVYPYTWDVFQVIVQENILISQSMGTFTQFPIRLAWALTIHKSQGKTFDHVIIDVGKGAFAPGQIYVAFSRCTSLEGIILHSALKKEHIRTDPHITHFFAHHRLRHSIQKALLPDQVKLIEEAIQKGGRLRVSYLKADHMQTDHILVPEMLEPKIYQGEPYVGLRAYCTEAQQKYIFRLDRILKLEKME